MAHVGIYVFTHSSLCGRREKGQGIPVCQDVQYTSFSSPWGGVDGFKLLQQQMNAFPKVQSHPVMVTGQLAACCRQVLEP